MVESFRGNSYAERHFRAIVDAARTTNPFYRRWITDPGEALIVDRDTFLAHNDEILNGYPVTGATSGSTGIRVRVSQSDAWVREARKDTLRFIGQLGGPVPVVHIIYRGDHTEADVVDVSTPLGGQIAAIQRRHREHATMAITTYPTNAHLLSDEVLRTGADMSFITRFGMYGESVEPFHTQTVRSAFPNARVWTTYSSVEFGMIASMCPYEPHFHHINAHRLGIEVLRDDDTPVEPGERGRVVITDYLNMQSPFIRYEIGDYAVPDRCPCGRIRLPAFSRIDGKIRGALLHRNGNRVLFADLSVALRDNDGMRQYQVIQDGVEDFTVRIVADRNLDEEVRKAFTGHFGYLPDHLRTVYVDAIQRGANGKFHASICNV